MKSSMKTMMLGGAAAIAMLTATPAFAQETSSGMRGVITAPDGSPIAGQTVVIRDTRTGSVKTVTTNNSGSWSARGMRVGGPYTIVVDSDQYTDETVQGVVLNLGGVFEANLQLDTVTDGIEEIVVTASSITTAQVAVGPNSTFNLSDLQNSPAINRDIKDIVRMDARVYIDEGNSDAIQCVGANPRFNSLTVDGVGLNDNFGLNSSGYPTTRVPFSFDAIQQVAVEMAPFDVEYGAFTGCNINAVTKSGSNEFHGGVFFDYTNDSMRGENVLGREFDNGDYNEKRYGATFGGPIIKDKLFFFMSYEKLEGAQLFDRRPGENTVTQTELDRISQIARDVYGYEVGPIVSSLPVKDEKFLAKIDWDINENHRLALVYNYNDGFEIRESDGDNDEFEFSDHYYESGNELKAYSGQLFSDWSENFSTEFRVSYTDLDNRQISRANFEIGEARIESENGIDVYLGNDDSRQSNDMFYKIWNYKAAGSYRMEDHNLTFGLERVDLEVFNLFVQHSIGEYRFNSIDDFENGIARVYYGNAPSQNPLDASGTLKYAINTAYIQDEYTIPDTDLTLTAGVRYDWYTSSDLPRENQNFIARNGFTNSTNLDGRGIFQPRVAFRWDASEKLTVRGGVGIYSGGNPNVWIVNNYQQDGFSQIQVNERNVNILAEPVANGGDPLKSPPQFLFDEVGSGTANSGVNAMDPNFKIPTQVKLALGATWDFDAGFLGRDYTLQADFLYSKMRNAATIIDSTLVDVGTAPDGRPLYATVDKSRPECLNADALNADSGLVFSCNRFGSSDFILTNENGGESTVFSASLSKSYDNGVDWMLGYAWTDAKDVNIMGSSVAFSNYAGPALTDPLNQTEGRSNWEIKHRLTARVSWAKDFWDDNTTRVTMFGSAQSGRPYSHVFNDMGGFFATGLDEFGDTIDSRHLLYVPTGINDPLINWSGDFLDNFGNVRTGKVDQFFKVLENQGLMEYAGGIIPRNSQTSDWWSKIDLRISQDIPAPIEGHKAQVFLVIENLTNFIDSDWGAMKNAGYFGKVDTVNASIDRDNNVYNYEGLVRRDPDGLGSPQSIITAPSKWEIRVGIKYDF